MSISVRKEVWNVMRVAEEGETIPLKDSPDVVNNGEERRPNETQDFAWIISDVGVLDGKQF